MGSYNLPEEKYQVPFGRQARRSELGSFFGATGRPQLISKIVLRIFFDIKFAISVHLKLTANTPGVKQRDHKPHRQRKPRASEIPGARADRRIKVCGEGSELRE